jgi:hypothetical protein
MFHHNFDLYSGVDDEDEEDDEGKISLLSNFI